jgi:putative membrane protein
MRALAAIVSALHLLALAIGLPAIWHRARLLGGSLDRAGLSRVFLADNAWGIAALLWITTGPLRAFTRLEKGPEFYLSTWLFPLKLGLFAVIFGLEVTPMVGLIRWRIAIRRGESPDLRSAGLYRRLSQVETALVVAIVFVAAFMARGFWMRG